jgi:hypothetical protein
MEFVFASREQDGIGYRRETLERVAAGRQATSVKIKNRCDSRSSVRVPRGEEVALVPAAFKAATRRR